MKYALQYHSRVAYGYLILLYTGKIQDKDKDNFVCSCLHR